MPIVEYKYPANAMINFQPMADALDGYSKGMTVAGESTAKINAGNAMRSGDWQTAQAELAKVDPRAAMEAGMQPLKREGAEIENRSALIKQIGGRAAAILQLEPDKQEAEARKWLSSDPRFHSGLTRVGLGNWSADPIAAVRAIQAEAQGVQPRFQPIPEGGLYDTSTRQVAVPGTPKKPDLVKDYEYYAQQERAASKTPKSFEDWDLERKKMGATAVTIGGEAGFTKEAGERQAKRFDALVERGYTAKALTGDLQALREIGSRITTGKTAEIKAALGPWAEALGIPIDQLDDIQAYRAITARMAPRMRPPGSGATSDFEMRQFLDSLPSIARLEGGNAVVDQVFQAIQDNDVAMAEIASKAIAGEITRQEAEKQLRGLPDPLTAWKQVRGGSAAQRPGGVVPSTPGGPATIQPPQVGLGTTRQLPPGPGPQQGPPPAIGTDSSNPVRLQPDITPEQATEAVRRMRPGTWFVHPGTGEPVQRK